MTPIFVLQVVYFQIDPEKDRKIAAFLNRELTGAGYSLRVGMRDLCFDYASEADAEKAGMALLRKFPEMKLNFEVEEM